MNEQDIKKLIKEDQGRMMHTLLSLALLAGITPETLGKQVVDFDSSNDFLKKMILATIAAETAKLTKKTNDQKRKHKGTSNSSL